MALWARTLENKQLTKYTNDPFHATSHRIHKLCPVHVMDLLNNSNNKCVEC